MSENGQKCGIPYGGYYMTSRKNIFVILGFVLSVSLIASGVCEFFVSYHSCRSRFELLSSVCGEAARKDRKDPETKHQGGNERGNCQEKTDL